MNIQTLRQRTKWMALVAVPVLACSRAAPSTAYAKARSERTDAAAQGTTSTKAAPAAALRLILAPTGNAARYRVRERLVGHDFPSDAIGETKNLSGAISFDSKGKVIREASKFTVDASTFVSDQNRRDGFVRGRLLESDDYPMITLVPTEVRGVSLPLPTTGSSPIEMTADLTVRSVTRPTTWKGTAQFKDGRVEGSASTAFTFDDIQIEQPRVPVLLSVADTIRLEINFNLVREP